MPRVTSGAHAPYRTLFDLSGCRRGTAALEFVLASGPTLLLLFGFIAVNAVFYTWSTMLASAQNAAMLMATGQITSFQSKATTCTGSLTSSQAEYYACQGLPTWASFSVTASENCTAPASVTVQVSANASAAALADVYAIFAGKTLQVQSSMMKQGTCP
jgi:Flp pilus assembly protein TadG